MTVLATAETVRQVLRAHRDVPGPDAHGRVHACSCSWWVPGETWASHLLDEFGKAGLEFSGVAARIRREDPS